MNDDRCVCGHVEISHPRVIGGCRGKNCKCQSFVNDERVCFLRNCVLFAIQEYRQAQADLKSRTKAA